MKSTLVWIRGAFHYHTCESNQATPMAKRLAKTGHLALITMEF
jgi:hypothetical protein